MTPLTAVYWPQPYGRLPRGRNCGPLLELIVQITHAGFEDPCSQVSQRENLLFSTRQEHSRNNEPHADRHIWPYRICSELWIFCSRALCISAFSTCWSYGGISGWPTCWPARQATTQKVSHSKRRRIVLFLLCVCLRPVGKGRPIGYRELERAIQLVFLLAGIFLAFHTRPERSEDPVV